MQVLEKGSAGPAVNILQAALKQAGFAIAVDGDFGNQTEIAVKEFQRRAGIAADGKVGPATWAALNAANGQNLHPVAENPTPAAEKPTPNANGVVPEAWMPPAKMQRVIVHWTAGGHKASALDRAHYHILIEGDARLVRGIPTIPMNQAPPKKGYAAHTLNCNSGSIAVSACCMLGSNERPFRPGKSPLTRAQWEMIPRVLADLSRRYGIPVSPKTMLSHAEVQSTLGIKQRGKWDISVLPFDVTVNTAKKAGDLMRAATAALLD